MNVENSSNKYSNSDILQPVLQILEVMKKNIQNKSFLRSLRAIARKVKNLIKKQVLDKTIFDNLHKLRNKKLPNSYEEVIDKIILPILNIFKIMGSSLTRSPLPTNVFFTKPYISNRASSGLSFA